MQEGSYWTVTGEGATVRAPGRFELHLVVVVAEGEGALDGGVSGIAAPVQVARRRLDALDLQGAGVGVAELTDVS